VQQHLRSKYAVFLGTNTLEKGEAIRYTSGGGDDIGGLKNNDIYYLIKATDSSFIKLAKTREDARNGIAVAINTTNTLSTSHRLSLVEGGVTVHAASNIETVNFAGVYGLNPMRFFTSGADTVGVGVSYLDISYVSSAEAEIRDGALVSAESLEVDANRTNKEISIAVSGGKAKKYGASGAISYLTVEKDGIDTLAHISDNAVVVSQDVPVFGSDASLRVNAYDYSKIFNVTGGVLQGANVGIGASVAINRIDRDTLAVVGNLEDDAAGSGSLFTPGNILVSAVNEGKIWSTSVAAAIAFQSKSKPPDLPNHIVPPEKTGKFGLHVSADVSLNVVRDTAQAYIKDADIRRAEDVTLYAKNDSDIFAIAGSVAFSISGNEGVSVGLAGAFSRNVIEDTTRAFIEDSTLSASGNLSLTTLTTGDIFSVTASGSGEVRDKAVAIAGSVSVNKIDNTTESYLDGTTVQDVDEVTLDASDDSGINAYGGGLAVAVGKSTGGMGGSLAVGASLAWSDIKNEIRAYVQDSAVSAAGDVTLDARSPAAIEAWTIGGGVAVGKSGGGGGYAGAVTGALSFNKIENTIEAYIKGVGTITSIDGDLTLTATDSASIIANAVGGSIAVGLGGGGTGGALSIGASIAHNTVANKTLA
ncbi:MAG: hypothetical protein JSW50_10000, partial [Candidatus Latescibacterota bacterium]